MEARGPSIPQGTDLETERQLRIKHLESLGLSLGLFQSVESVKALFPSKATETAPLIIKEGRSPAPSRGGTSLRRSTRQHSRPAAVVVSCTDEDEDEMSDEVRSAFALPLSAGVAVGGRIDRSNIIWRPLTWTGASVPTGLGDLHEIRLL